MFPHEPHGDRLPNLGPGTAPFSLLGMGYGNCIKPVCHHCGIPGARHLLGSAPCGRLVHRYCLEVHFEACEPCQAPPGVQVAMDSRDCEPKAPNNCLGYCTWRRYLPDGRRSVQCRKPCARGLWADVEGKHSGACRCDLHCRNKFTEEEEPGADSDDSCLVQVCRASAAQRVGSGLPMPGSYDSQQEQI